MPIRYIVRPPNILTTPRKLKEVLNAQRTVNPRVSRRSLSFVDDLFLYYPDLPHEISEYQVVREFFKKYKNHQQAYIRSFGVKTPWDYPAHNNQYVVRPLRHSGGESFEVVSSETTLDINEGYKYSTPLFPKVKEYRMIFVKGVPIITLRKVFQSSTPGPSLPWNHTQGAFFNTIQAGHQGSSLRHSNAVADLLNVPVVQHAHIIGADIMLNAANEYAVCELNFCPAITIPDNLEKIRATLVGE